MKPGTSPLPFNTAFAILLLSGIIMGFSPVFVREAEVGAFASAFWRIATALPALGLWAWFESRKTGQSFISAFPISAILAGMFFAGDLIFWHLSILNTTMANATFTVCLSVVWVAIFSNWVLGEQINKTAWAGLVLCLAGLAMLISSSLDIAPERLIGDIYGLITSVFLGLYFLAMRFARREMQSGQLFFNSSIITGIVLFAAMLASGDKVFPDTSAGWTSLVSLGLFTHVGGQGLVTIALGSLSAMFSSLVIFIEALAAAFFGWWWFGEEMSPMQWFGGFLILGGVWLARPVSVRKVQLKQT